MKKIRFETSCKKMLADVYTPVGIYLRLRDRFRDTLLLESSEHHTAENSWSFLCIHAVGGLECRTLQQAELKFPGQPPEKLELKEGSGTVDRLLWSYMERFEPISGDPVAKLAQGLFGYTSYDAVQFFERLRFREREEANPIPLIRYRLYQYVIAIDHFHDELYLCTNAFPGLKDETEVIEALIRNKDVPQFPFALKGEEQSDVGDEDFLRMVEQGIGSCHRGDVFQIVLSRRFRQAYRGDEFNVYRALRSINPSPYLFYFDYGDYRLLGSSPEAQLVVRDGRALVHPIAGTFRRTGEETADRQRAEDLLSDPKENAEHVMLVDLARNDLSRYCDDVQVARYRQVHYYSHVIHLVSEVSGRVREGGNPFELFSKTFPAGTLSGAPKYRAMELIDQHEASARGFYGGAIGFAGFDGSFNHAIMIRSLMARNNTLEFRAGAGVVAASKPASELQEVHNKLNALRDAMRRAQQMI